MSSPIVIIGSGFAAYQLVKSIRRLSKEQAIIVITAGSGDDYVKPELSHVFSKKLTAQDMVKQSGIDFAAEYNIILMKNTYVDEINRTEKTVSCHGIEIAYDNLVLATGAQSFVPFVDGDAAKEIITLNSLDEYQQSQEQLANAKSVLVVGAGLVGTEIAMDLAIAHYDVILSDRSDSLLPNLLPEFISSQLYQAMRRQGVQLQLGNELSKMTKTDAGIEVRFKSGHSAKVDCVVCAAGLKPNTTLASLVGLAVNCGIVVDKQLRTNDPHIFAIGDCAEIDGKHLAFLQPIILSANALAKTLTNAATNVIFPAMLVKVKTPLYPIQLSGNTTAADARWQVEFTTSGMTAKAFDRDEVLMGFVVTQANMPEAFKLLRLLPNVPQVAKIL
ncbi:Nitric oxide reductase FlRd-NAD(+) reductase [Moritella sp. JT01]|uniref:NADH:flavorubredoxin reductase NorW n=1 Tax=Moritella sp. JT01 TaxID=756698 RepID=UPI000793136E|nr:NADH:flavorubredoxin reductase NorW [Moritella sp. JT01]KXO14068.1 Nitric oxide reductase FlRd-NAD(+) reductase [Moritella sp. JT01]